MHRASRYKMSVALGFVLTLLIPSLGLAQDCIVDMSSDGTYESHVCWSDVFTDAGWFAECFHADSRILICRVLVDLSRVGPQGSGELQVALIRDHGGVPIMDPLCVTTVPPSPIAEWPEITRKVIEFSWCNTELVGSFWIAAYEAQTDPPQPDCSWVVPVDQNGPGGCPYAAGVSHGSQWDWRPLEQWYGVPARAIGIGIEYYPLDPTPLKQVSWGRVRTLYR
jgi:hypothetical protein